MNDGEPVHDAEGKELNARFFVKEGEDGRLHLVFKSAGGGTYNRDYNPALELVLKRLAKLRATLERVEVASNETAELPDDERTFEPEGYTLPLALAEQDAKPLRTKIGAGAAKTARRPGAREDTSGNPQKRLRLVLRLESQHGAEEVARTLRGGHRYTTRLPLPLAVEDAPTGPPSTGGGQGFEQDPEIRVAVESYAMDQCEAYYADWRSTRRDQEKCGYDIELNREGEQLFVEVKGSRGPKKSVILTRNEVDHAHRESAKSVLFVVTSIQIEKTEQGVDCHGGQITVFEGWDPRAVGRLKVKDYVYDLPEDATDHRTISQHEGE